MSRHVLVCVPPFPEVLNKFSGIPITAFKLVLSKRYCTTNPPEELDNILSGTTIPILPPGFNNFTHNSKNKICGEGFFAIFSVLTNLPESLSIFHV